MSLHQVLVMRVLRSSGVFLLAAITTSGCSALHLAKTTPAPKSTPSAKADASRTSQGLAVTLESQDQRLSAALLAVAILPRPETYRQLASEYQRLGVLDKAHEHFSNAVAMDPTDAASYDALARIWRDWGSANLGLGDAYRAVYFAPDSPEAANTLGTLLQATGHIEDAKLWYARALHLDRTAWYALNNLCYAEILTGKPAVNTCQAAVSAAPGVRAKVAQNNLALAHAAAGDTTGARQWFRRAGDPATADYNYGIAMMATRAYKEAAAAFDEALRTNPHFPLAAARAQQARQAAERVQEDAR